LDSRSSKSDEDDDDYVTVFILCFLAGVVLVEVVLVCFWLWGLAGMG
jgi:hypothetical protein